MQFINCGNKDNNDNDDEACHYLTFYFMNILTDNNTITIITINIFVKTAEEAFTPLLILLFFFFCYFTIPIPEMPKLIKEIIVITKECLKIPKVKSRDNSRRRGLLPRRRRSQNIYPASPRRASPAPRPPWLPIRSPGQWQRNPINPSGGSLAKRESRGPWSGRSCPPGAWSLLARAPPNRVKGIENF